MSFINKKEEVIKLELTQFGKRLLSKGNFKPQYYQFFDDDIIYDSNYAGTDEKQNNIQTRIKDGISLDVQYSVTSLEDKFDQETEEIESGDEDLFKEIKHSVNTTEKEKLLSYPLSTISPGASSGPLFNLAAADSKIKNTTLTFLTQSGIQSKIPQIEFNPNYRVTRDVTLKTVDENQIYDSESYVLDFTQDKITFFDNTFLETSSEDIVITLEETSVPFLKDNFEIEVFEVITNADGEENFKEVSPETLSLLFEITTDKDADEVLYKRGLGQNFFGN